MSQDKHILPLSCCDVMQRQIPDPLVHKASAAAVSVAATHMPSRKSDHPNSDCDQTLTPWTLLKSSSQFWGVAQEARLQVDVYNQSAMLITWSRTLAPTDQLFAIALPPQTTVENLKLACHHHPFA